MLPLETGRQRCQCGSVICHEVVQKLRTWIHAGNEQVVTCPGARDVEKVTLCLVNFL